MSDKPQLSSVERTIRIERLRLQAAIDRETITQSTYRLAQSCRPSNIVGKWLSKTSFGQPTHFLSKGVNLISNYPYLSAGVSSLLLGRQSRVLRIFGLVLGSLGAWRAVLKATARDQSPR